ncbi:MAG: beta-ketoacyl-ACP synthase II [Gammaproteobacteria bacterium]|nr:beta-ketoacyl-ACP synthase II [Gammaproteobacteria bacterium]
MNRRRIVVTGLGCVTPLGNTVKDSWDGAVAGRSGIGLVTRCDVSNLPCKIAGEVKGLDLDKYLSARDIRTLDTFIHYGVVAAKEAAADAGLETGEGLSDEQSERYGCVIGSGIGGLSYIERTAAEYAKSGHKRVSPFFVPGTIINMPAGIVSIELNLRGPSFAVSSACTTGLHSIGEAARIIRYGDADLMLAGGTEASICPLGLSGFSAMRALSTHNAEPEKASRPWDKNRDGFVMGEGAGVMVLEELAHAKARNARIYCELVGYGLSSDASHITAPNVDGPYRAMSKALSDARLNVDEVQYINAHGTSTQLGDINETNAIVKLFGEHSKKLLVSSTKSMTGHLLGGAGGVESIFSVLAIWTKTAPPTINLDQQDENSLLDHCAHWARSMPIEVVMKNNFGFGGTNGCLIFQRFKE